MGDGWMSEDEYTMGGLTKAQVSCIFVGCCLESITHGSGIKPPASFCSCASVCD